MRSMPQPLPPAVAITAVLACARTTMPTTTAHSCSIPTAITSRLFAIRRRVGNVEREDPQLRSFGLFLAWSFAADWFVDFASRDRRSFIHGRSFERPGRARASGGIGKSKGATSHSSRAIMAVDYYVQFPC